MAGRDDAEATVTAHGLRLTAYGQDEVEIRVGEGAADGLRSDGNETCVAEAAREEPDADGRRPEIEEKA